MSHTLRSLLIVSLLLFSVPAMIGCGSRRPTTYSSPEGIERPAKAMEDEKSFSDRAGEVLVVVLVVGGALAMIALPIVLLVL